MNDLPAPGARHRISEASAGTGKTTWITQQAVKLLTAGTPLESILFMTFTERATGDLKARLRLAVETAREQEAEHQPLLQAALDQFDQAQVYTIHGFCQRVLLDHPFETGCDFRPVLADDAPLYEGCLRELQRTAWRERYGNGLGDILRTIGYQEANENAKSWEDLVVTVAGCFRSGCNSILRPTYSRSSNGLASPPNAYQLAVETVSQLQEMLRVHKRERGLFSFEDMLTLLARALDPQENPRAPLLLAALRRRYRVAIIDEFQDTDPLQWSIFKRIFVEDPGPERLFVVGDPKQAIYGFLGADVYAYGEAVNELKARRDTAPPEHLTTNWRTCVELLEPLNQLFDKGKWFADTDIVYEPLTATPTPVHRLVADQSGRAALTLVDLQDDFLPKARRTFARFVAAEIHRLLHGADGRPLLQVQKKDEAVRPLRGSDICILVRSRTEARPLLCCLRQWGIPVSFYKQSGLWTSDEAEQLAFLLNALARPEEADSLRKALLSTFLRVKPEELASREELTEDLPAVRQYRQWCELAEKRHWGQLFQSLLNDSGLLFADMREGGYERRLANFRHLFGFLEQAAYRQGFDLVGLTAALHQQKNSHSTVEGNDFQPIETERAKVRIMTIHTAKGDEYPVVFVAGAFTISGRERSPRWYHYRDDGKLVFHLQTKQNLAAQVEHEREALREDKRLLYVALTRAMFKLYLPRLKEDGYKGKWEGCLVKVLGPAIAKAGLERLKPSQVNLIPSNPRVVKTPGMAPPHADEPVLSLPEDLFPEIRPEGLRRGIRMRSYSMLRRSHVPATEAVFSERPPRDDEDTTLEQDGPNLLRGTLFGVLVHETLERLDFAAVTMAAAPQALLAPGPIRDLLQEVFHNHAADLPADREAALLQVARVIWYALRTPLEPLGCRLGNIPPEDRLHELEFHFPERLAGDSGLTPTEGFFTGFMDLVFRKAGRYYLLDWKTNDLGGDYDQAALARCMDESDYRRQYQLYLIALTRWLHKRVPGFDFALDFAGVFYLFVRGMNGRDQSGVFYCPGSAADLHLQHVLESSERRS
jgi:exodeoxyribonuclease V beta subunit